MTKIFYSPRTSPNMKTRNPHAGALRHYKPKTVPDKRAKLREKIAKKEIDKIKPST